MSFDDLSSDDLSLHDLSLHDLSSDDLSFDFGFGVSFVGATSFAHVFEQPS